VFNGVGQRIKPEGVVVDGDYATLAVGGQRERRRLRPDASCNLERLLRSLTSMAVEWRDAYRKAMQDQPRDSLIEALRMAEDAIQARLKELEGLTLAGHGMERAALKTAMRDLSAIKTRARLP
jgi:hypothetical protein